MGRKRADGEGTYFHDTSIDSKTGKRRNLWRYTITINGKPKTFSAGPKNGGKKGAKANIKHGKKNAGER